MLSDADVNDKLLQMLVSNMIISVRFHKQNLILAIPYPLFTVVCLQEDINVTTEVGRQHILGQTIEEKKRLLKNWILRDHHSAVSQSRNYCVHCSLIRLVIY